MQTVEAWIVAAVAHEWVWRILVALAVAVPVEPAAVWLTPAEAARAPSRIVTFGASPATAAQFQLVVLAGIALTMIVTGIVVTRLAGRTPYVVAADLGVFGERLAQVVGAEDRDATRPTVDECGLHGHAQVVLGGVLLLGVGHRGG